MGVSLGEANLAAHNDLLTPWYFVDETMPPWKPWIIDQCFVQSFGEYQERSMKEKEKDRKENRSTEK